MPALSTDPRRDDAYRKIMWRIMPFLLCCYVVGYMDRSSLGIAKLQFMEELGLNQYVFGLITSVFYIGYIAFDAPSNMLLHKIGAPKTFMRIMVLWGLTTASMMFARNANWLLVQRFLLGTFEAGFFPGVLLYLTYWFPDRLRARATSFFMVGIPLSGIMGGAITGPVMEGMDGLLGLRGWQWLFVVDGVPAILCGVIAAFYLTDKPANARFLTEAERQIVEQDLQADRREVQQAPSASVIAVLRDWRVWLLGCVYFSISFFTSSNQVWFPTLLKTAGAGSPTDIGNLLTGIWAVAAIGILVTSHRWNRSKERRVQYAWCGLVAVASYLALSFVSGNIWLTAVLLAIGATAGYSGFVVFWTIPPRFLEGRGAALGIALVTMMGSVGPLISPVVVGWTFERTGSLYTGLAAVACVTLAGTLLALRGIPRSRLTAPVMEGRAGQLV